jgi:hypothetical protein
VRLRGGSRRGRSRSGKRDLRVRGGRWRLGPDRQRRLRRARQRGDPPPRRRLLLMLAFDLRTMRVLVMLLFRPTPANRRSAVELSRRHTQDPDGRVKIFRRIDVVPVLILFVLTIRRPVPATASKVRAAAVRMQDVCMRLAGMLARPRVRLGCGRRRLALLRKAENRRYRRTAGRFVREPGGGAEGRACADGWSGVGARAALRGAVLLVGGLVVVGRRCARRRRRAGPEWNWRDWWRLVATRQRAEHVPEAAHPQPAVSPLLCGRRVASRLFGRKRDRATRRLAPEPASVWDFFKGL